MKRVLQFAYGQAAPAALRSLSQSFQVVGLIVPPTEAGSDIPVLREAASETVPKVQCPNPQGLRLLVDQYRPDVVVICSYDRILLRRHLPEVPVINVHYAPLPRYRGRATVNWAILNDLRTFALTIHQVVPELDAGPILHQAWCSITDSDTIADVYKNLNEMLEAALGNVVTSFIEGRLIPVGQTDEVASYVCTRLPEDGQIDWTLPARTIYNQVRALTRPFPGAFTFINAQRVFVWKAAMPNKAPNYEGVVPGRVIKISKEGPVDVLCGEGILTLLSIQAEGAPETAPAELIRSVKTTLSDGTAARLAQLESQVADMRGLLIRGGR